MAGKTLLYEHCDAPAQQKLDDPRKHEWKKLLDFGASVKPQGKVLDELTNEGHRPIPTRWAEHDKTSAEETLMKSRLVECDQFEDSAGI